MLGRDLNKVRWGQAPCWECEAAGCGACGGTGKRLAPALAKGYYLTPESPDYDEALRLLQQRDIARVMGGK